MVRIELLHELNTVVYHYLQDILCIHTAIVKKNQIEFVNWFKYLTYLEMKLFLIIPSFLAIAAINVNGQESGQLLMGTLVRQGSDKSEALGDMGMEGVEEVKVHESKLFHFEFCHLITFPNVVFVWQKFYSF